MGWDGAGVTKKATQSSPTNETKRNETIETNQKMTKFACCVFDAAGHTNPLLALTSELCERGHHVLFVLASPMMVGAIKKSKAKFTEGPAEEGGSYSFETLWTEEDLARFAGPREDIMKGAIPETDDQTEDQLSFPNFFLYSWAKGVETMDAYKRIAKSVDAFIADPIMMNPSVVALMEGKPLISTVTFPQFACVPSLIGIEDEEEQRAKMEMLERAVHESSDKLRKDFYPGFNFFKNFVSSAGMLPTGLNLCTGVKEFDKDLPALLQRMMGEEAKDSMHYVGPMVLSEEDGHISQAPKSDGTVEGAAEDAFPMDRIEQWKAEGRKVIYASFGTVASNMVWNWEEADSGEWYAPHKCLGARQSGKVYCTHLFTQLMEAFGGTRDVAVVLSSGPHFDECGLEVPENFLVRPSVPQVEVLEHVDAFVSHGGANSLFESIAAAVPLLILPHFGDQHANGKMVVDLDIGLYHDDPVAEVTAEVLREDVAKLLDPQIASMFKRKMQRLHESIRSAGGARRAVDLIETYVENFKGHAPAKLDEPVEVFQRCGTGEIKDFVIVDSEIH